MTKKRRTRRALINSVISLLICFSMLLGTTFAWFTDEVKTGMNTIQAGNLDVELVHSNANVTNENVTGATDLFYGLDGEEILWEPGVVAYENLQVVNVGTLALKYQMTLNVGYENDLNGHKLSEVLQVAVIDAIEPSTADRLTVLADAKAAVEANQGKGALSNFYQTGELEAGDSSEEKAVVIFWEPNANDIDNLYNVNNGQVTSDGDPLHIKFGVNLQATQKMSEDDSFGNDYDEFASILPKATVINTGSKTVPVFMGIAEDEIELDTSFQFLPNETEDEAASSAYKYWHADYVISADNDVPAGSIALAGYYKAWCGDNGWVVMTNDGEDITAGTEIRLVEQLGATVNYEEICHYGNDGTGFLCGATDLTGENAGTTITVELRLYETTIDPSNPTGTANEETGDYEVIGTYTYTFPGAAQGSIIHVSNAAELQDALDNAANGDVIALDADINGNVTATQKPDVKVTINGRNNTFAGSITVDGKSARYATAGVTILDVNFEADSLTADAYINLGVKGDNNTRYTNNVTVKNCTFSYTGADDKVAVKSYTGGDRNLTIDGCTVNTGMHSLLQATNVEKGLKITNCEVYSKNGININNTPYLDMSDCEFDTVGYCVRFGVNGSTNNGEFTIANSTLTSANDDGDAVIILRGDMAGATVNIPGTTLIGTPEITGEATINR